MCTYSFLVIWGRHWLWALVGARVEQERVVKAPPLPAPHHALPLSVILFPLRYYILALHAFSSTPIRDMYSWPLPFV